MIAHQDGAQPWTKGQFAEEECDDGCKVTIVFQSAAALARMPVALMPGQAGQPTTRDTAISR